MEEKSPEKHIDCGGFWIYGDSKMDRLCQKCRKYQYTNKAVQLFEIRIPEHYQTP